MKPSHPNQNFKINILVVDDTPNNLRLLSAMLTGENYEVRKALNGAMALTACQRLLPDLILLDVMMPEMDGYEVCRCLKAEEQTSAIPVIFISALDDVFDKVKAFEAGAVDYIIKPFQQAEVIARIENHLNLHFLRIELQQNNTLLQQEVQERLRAETTLKLQKQQLEQALADLQQAQTQLIQNEKMAALGQLVAGIAHEFNNPVNFILGNLSCTKDYILDLLNLVAAYQVELPNPSVKIQQLINDIDLTFLINDAPDLIQSMQRGATRIQELVISLRNFVRLDEAEMKAVDIHEGIESTLLILQHRLRKTDIRPGITVIKAYGELPLVTCYASQLNQVFMHLLNNAIDALEGQGDNECFSIPNPQIHIHTELTDNELVRIRIADNGCGIPDSIRARLFDPFFTTKPVGSGTGLGLSISYQIVVQQHRGKLSCFSSVGQGSEFEIEIPVN